MTLHLEVLETRYACRTEALMITAFRPSGCINAFGQDT